MIINNRVLNIDDYYFEVFMSISESLTGFSIAELQGTGLATAYYIHILNNLQAVSFISFLDLSKMLIDQSKNVQQLNNAIVTNIISDPAQNEIANKLITLWYLGTWEGAYINELSYKEGLVWNIIHAHPPGAKQPGFKSWESKPII